jgi:hypothetical protein
MADESQINRNRTAALTKEFQTIDLILFQNNNLYRCKDFGGE